MIEPVTEPEPPETFHDPVELTQQHARELARKNLIWGWSLLGLFVLLFAGTVGVAYVYLWLD
ncbi:MAG: hypothetical protein ACRDM1_02600 [Gaiellaceae bacterium]